MYVTTLQISHHNTYFGKQKVSHQHPYSLVKYHLYIPSKILKPRKNLQISLFKKLYHYYNLLPFAPSFDICERSMKCVPTTSSVTESLEDRK